MKNFHMKSGLIMSLLVCAVGLGGCDQSAQPPEDLPWQINISAEGNPQVFHLEVGKSTLKDMIEYFRNFPEVAVFAHESRKRTLEAYFGKQRIGLFEAKLIAELQADDAMFDKFQNEASKREGMASGQWKHTLSEANQTIANGLVVSKLVYLPSINYEPEVVAARFGEPAERLPATKTGVEFWFYPQQGLAIMLDVNGGEILYYTTPALYPALKQELLEAKPKNAD